MWVQMSSRLNVKKSRIIITVVIFWVMVYLTGIFFFTHHLIPGTQLNGINLTGKTQESALRYLEKKADYFCVTVTLNDEPIETVYGHEIGLHFDGKQAVENLINDQNPFLWPLFFLRLNQQETVLGVSFDSYLLYERILRFDVVTNGIKPPISAKISIENSYTIITDHEYGNIVNLPKLEQLLINAISSLSHTVPVTEKKLFIQPEFTTDSIEVIDAYATVNVYLSTVITHITDVEYVIDRHLISKWINIDDQLNATINETELKVWLNQRVKAINTQGSVREFMTPRGRSVYTTGGTFGWVVDEEKERQQLIEEIKSGRQHQREPVFASRGVVFGSNDWGHSFLQVDLTDQVMWAIIDDEVVFESAIVTGRPLMRRITPEGAYSVIEKLSPKVLVGAINPATGKPLYERPVSYWIRITWTGHGFHDALWQPRFGGAQYRFTGSHGCINLPLWAAGQLYEIAYLGMPVLIHY